MRAMKAWIRGVWLLPLLLGVAAAAAAPGLRINQVADEAPELAVFLSGLPAPAKAASQPGATPVASAGLGELTLRVKSLAPWDPSTGISLVVALDVSASMARDFDAIKRAVGGLVGRLPPGSQVALMAIGSEARTVQGFGPAAGALAQIDALRADAPETALYEAILAGQQMAAGAGKGRPLRRLLLVVTDALDDSRHGFSRDETLQKIAQGATPLLALAMAPDAPPAAQRDAIKALAGIARASGGAFMQSSAARAPQNLDLLLAEALRTQLLMLDCSACVRDGVARQLQVSAQIQGVQASDTRSVRLLAAAVADPPPPTSSPTSTRPVPDGRTFSLPQGLGLLGLLVVGLAGGLAFWWRKRQRDQAAAAAGNATPPGGVGVDDVTLQSTMAAVVVVAQGRDGKPVTLDIDGQGAKEVRVGQQDVVLGRSTSADLPLGADAEASGRHAALYRAKGLLMVRDLGSANGTWLNGTRILKPEPVNDRDVLRVGRTEVRVYFDVKRRAAQG